MFNLPIPFSIIRILRTVLAQHSTKEPAVYASPLHIRAINGVANVFFSNKNVQSSEIIFEQTVISNLLSLDGVETAIREEYNTLRYEFTLWKIRDKRQIFDIPAALGES